MFKIKKDVLFCCLALTVYYAIMEIYYVHFIVLNYEQYGFTLNINYIKYAETKFLFLIVLVMSLLVSRISGFIYSIYTFFVVFFLVPISITYSHSDQATLPLYSTIALLTTLTGVSPVQIKLSTISKSAVSDQAIVFFLLVASVPFVLQFGLYLNPGNFVLVNIDQTRQFYDDHVSAVVNYLYNVLVKAVLPLCFVYFVVRKQYVFAWISLLIVMYLYIISGNKIVYITIFVTIFFAVLGSNYHQKIRYFMVSLVVGLLVLPLVDYYILDNSSLKGVFVMRMFFLPAQLNYLYIDFFHDQSLYYSGSSFFNLFTRYPFDKAIGYVISEAYFAGSDMNANNGIIGDGFMNLGYFGILINIGLVSLVMICFNSLRLDARYLGVFFVMVFLFLSVPMLSMFITSGIIILLLMLTTVLKNHSTNLK